MGSPGNCAIGLRYNDLGTECTATPMPFDGRTYRFRVSARNELGVGSPITSDVLSLKHPPHTPIAVVARHEVDHTVLSWETIPGGVGRHDADGFQIEMLRPGVGWVVATGSCSPANVGHRVVGSCIVPVDNTGTSAIERFRLRALAQGTAQSPWAESGSVGYPEHAVNVGATAGDGQVALRWEPPVNRGNAYVNDYRVYRSPSGVAGWTFAGGSCAAAVVSSATSCVDVGLDNGTTYYYRVAPRNVRGFERSEFVADDVVSATPAAAPGSDALLDLAVVDARLSPAFDPVTSSYTVTLPAGRDSVRLYAHALDPAASITLDGEPLAQGTLSPAIALDADPTVVSVTVNGSGTYQLSISRDPPPHFLDFDRLAYSVGGSEQDIVIDGPTPTVVLADGVDTVALRVDSNTPDALIKLDGVTIGTGSVSGHVLSLGYGETERTLLLESADSSDTRQLTLRWRTHSSALAALRSPDGELVDIGAGQYTMAVPFEQSTLRLAAIAEDPMGSRIRIDGVDVGSGASSTPIALIVGHNEVPIQITSREGATRAYAVAIERAADTGLVALGSPDAALSPPFHRDIDSYRINVPAGAPQLTLRAVTRDRFADISIAGEPVGTGAPYDVPLASDSTTIPVVVTGSDGTSARTYTVTVDRGVPSYIVTPGAGANGSISPATPQGVVQGQRVGFQLSPDSGYRIAGVTGSCGGSLGGAVYTTDPVSADCTVVASFEPITAVPGAPQNVVGTPGDAQIVVAWAAPASDGGTPVSGYTARATPVPPAVGGTASCSAAGSATSCTLLGLVNGVPYAVSVTASNAEGTGNPGTAAGPVTPLGAPGAPLNVSAVLTGPSTALVSWNAPASNGGAAIQSYAVVSTPAGANCSSATATVRSCAVSGLVDGQTYTFAVTANNGLHDGAAGVSAPLFVGAGVDISVQVRRVAASKAEHEKVPLRHRYVIEVTNHGSRLVDGIRLQVLPSRGFETLDWTCAAPGGCAPAAGSDAVDALFGLGVGQVAVFELVGDIRSDANFVQLFAEATLPAGMPAVQQGDDRVVYTVVIGDGLMLDGFE